MSIHSKLQSIHQIITVKLSIIIIPQLYKIKSPNQSIISFSYLVDQVSTC